ARADGLRERGVPLLLGARRRPVRRGRRREARLATPRQQRGRRGDAQHDGTPPPGQTSTWGRWGPAWRPSLVARIASHVMALLRVDGSKQFAGEGVRHAANERSRTTFLAFAASTACDSTRRGPSPLPTVPVRTPADPDSQSALFPTSPKAPAPAAP